MPSRNSHSKFFVLAVALVVTQIASGTSSGHDSDRHDRDDRSEVSQPAFVTVSGGDLMGAKVDGVYAFKGIPYALAERFQEPQAASWTNIRKALAFGETCPNGAQNVNVHEFVTESNHDMVENENCLNLNVWSTSLSDKAFWRRGGQPKPVIVWIHGGGFTSGSSVELPYYDGANLAEDQDIVFVSMNHRLNVLGYLDLSAYGPEYASTGNLGQLDLVAALRWVRENVAQFGGDPNNVTIVGQSGGAGKVVTLMGMPSAQGLFHKAVALSGGSSGRPQTQARAAAANLFTALGIATVAELKQVPYRRLIDAANAARVGASPVIDGVVYPAATITAGKFSEFSRDIPLMVSNTFGEFCGNSVSLTAWTTSVNPLTDVYRPNTPPARVHELLTQRFGDAKNAIVQEFRRVYPDHDLFDLLFFMAGCGPNRIPTADAKAAQGGAPVYSAVYAMNLPWFGGVVSVHTGGDLPFLLDNPETIPHLIAGEEGDAFRLAKEASTALGNFARTGNPSDQRLRWPAYNPDTQWTMIFDKRSRALKRGDRDLIDQVLAARN
jgi:para-nitrobenzyl esterase